MVIVIAEGAGQELLPECILSPALEMMLYKAISLPKTCQDANQSPGSLCKSEKDDDKSKIHRVSITNNGNDPTTLQVPLCQKQISSTFLPMIA
ncbi:hypothetical protein POTOM_005073 [Populus tomentosa]|uniref:Uncharacterized protein n=1 Tax=Populus tomentosa TaxID=118781 RepID=A0A8X8AGN6_POPTO|nr:hypothetical protein POTOM_005073 [Populus tomentosa]